MRNFLRLKNDIVEKDLFIFFELQNVLYEWGKPRECEKCKKTRYSDRYCEQCISLHLQSLFDTWTSGNEIIDDFIRQCQKQSSLPDYILEWIPFEQFAEIKKLAEGEFGTIYTVEWIRGTIEYYNKKKKFVYSGAYTVVLKCLNNSEKPAKA